MNSIPKQTEISAISKVQAEAQGNVDGGRRWSHTVCERERHGREERRERGRERGWREGKTENMNEGCWEEFFKVMGLVVHLSKGEDCHRLE